eukprot:COSAG01_NODE_10117_length_2256_cov_1.380819_1_plen_70_part_10
MCQTSLQLYKVQQLRATARNQWPKFRWNLETQIRFRTEPAAAAAGARTRAVQLQPRQQPAGVHQAYSRRR